MVRVPALVLALLIAPLGAGCLQAPAADAAAEPLASGDDAAATLESWFVLNATAGPEANLTAFWWTVPEGAVVASAFFEDWETIVVEAAFLAEGGDAAAEVPLTEWALFAFIDDGDGLYPLASYIDTPLEMEGRQLLVMPIEDRHVPEAKTMRLRLGIDAIEEGERVGFVLAARSDAPLSFQLALRALDEDPGWNDVPASTQEFMAPLEGRQPVRLSVVGTGTGLDVDGRTEASSTFLVPFTYTATAGEVESTGGLLVETRPAATLRDQTLRAAHDARGWSYAYAVYFANDGVGEWSAKVDIHGETLEAGAPVVQSWSASATLLASSVLWGFPFYVGMGEGETGATSEMRLEVTNSNLGGYEVWHFFQAGLGATLNELLGAPAQRETYSWEGILGETSGLLLAPDGDLHRVGAGWHVLKGAVPPDALGPFNDAVSEAQRPVP